MQIDALQSHENRDLNRQSFKYLQWMIGIGFGICNYLSLPIVVSIVVIDSSQIFRKTLILWPLSGSTLFPLSDTTPHVVSLSVALGVGRIKNTLEAQPQLKRDSLDIRHGVSVACSEESRRKHTGYL